MQNGRNTGINAALISALFLGLAPVFGKAAMGEGKFSPLAVVALRTSLAALLLVILITLSKRRNSLYLPGRFSGLYDGWRGEWVWIHFLLRGFEQVKCQRCTNALCLVPLLCRVLAPT